MIFFPSIGAIAAGFLLMTGIANDVRAAVIVTAFETGGNVVISTAAGGFLDITSLDFLQTAAGKAEISPVSTLMVIGPASITGGDAYEIITVPSPFGVGAGKFASFGSGDLISVDSLGRLVVPSNYVSGAPLFHRPPCSQVKPVPRQR